MRLPLLLCCLALATGAAAQTSPIITAADMPVVGDTLRLSAAAVGLPASAPPLGRNGAGQTWNYAALAATSQRVARYQNVGTATGALLQFTFNNALFSPDTHATLVSPQALPAGAGALPVTNPLEFAAVSSADFRLVGYGATLSGAAVPITYASKTQQDVIYRFPLSYASGTTVGNSLLITPVALASNGYFSQRRQRTNQPDGWGTLITPFGTFQAVRVVTSLRDHDSLAVGAAPGQGFDLPLQRAYKWLANGVHVPLLTITTTMAAGQEVITGVEYRDSYRKINLLADRSPALAADLRFFPNPSAAGTALRLVVPVGGGPLTVAATDLVGKSLFSRQFAGNAGEVLLDAAAFGDYRGLLLLTVTTRQGTATRRVVRE